MKIRIYYHIVTFGCQMNVHESEKLAAICEKMGYVYTENREDADLIIFNTCAIREGAEDRVFGNVGALKRLKKKNPNLIIAVCGCMTQKQTTADHMMRTFPFVDIVIGTFNLPNFEHYVHAVQVGRLLEMKKNKKVTQEFVEKSPHYKEFEGKVKSARQLHLLEEGDIDESVPYKRTSGENAWVNIMQGCNNFCTYCIVPYVRGREKSRQKENILKEIREIVAEGKYKKITLLGQNVNSYGKDLVPEVSFAELLKDICAIEGDFKLWFMTSHPKDLTDDVIETIANEDKILKDIHLPAQSGNNRILQMMNRRYTREKYLDIIHKIREKMPNARITSDFIVGFPTETEEEFQDTMKLVDEVKYDSIFAFMYSPREGTVASKMDGQVPQEIKQRRVNELLALEKKIQKQEGKK